MKQAAFAFDEATTIQERFEAFDREHPEIFESLVTMAFDLRKRGFHRYGLKSLFERLRWHFQVERGDEDWKLNNIYTSRYVRKMIQEYPELDGFFETRRLKAE
jgi:hypothetical protein